MPKRIIPLTDTKVRNSKPQEREYKLFDGGGLFLMVTPSGGKLWHFKYRFDGKEKKLALGAYPEISLSDARQRRENTRSQLAHGIDPGAVRKAQKQTFVDLHEPTGLSRQGDRHSFPLQDAVQTIEWQMIGKLADNQIGDQPHIGLASGDGVIRHGRGDHAAK